MDDMISVPDPPLVDLLSLREEEKGSPLTEKEVLEIAKKAHRVQISRYRYWDICEKRGYGDLNLDNVWREWQELSNRHRTGS